MKKYAAPNSIAAARMAYSIKANVFKGSSVTWVVNASVTIATSRKAIYCLNILVSSSLAFAQNEKTLSRLTTAQAMKTALSDISVPWISVYLNDSLVRLAPLYTSALTISHVAIMSASNMVHYLTLSRQSATLHAQVDLQQNLAPIRISLAFQLLVLSIKLGRTTFVNCRLILVSTRLKTKRAIS